MTPEEYGRLDAVAIADLVRSGRVSRTEIVDAATAQHEATHDTIHAVVEWYDDPEMHEGVDGPLAGVPVLRKDYGSTERGRLVEMGSRLAEGNVAEETTVFFSRLAEAGAMVLGRSAVPEFIQHGSTESTLFGITRNPHRPSVSSGGSSGGSGSAVAAGVVPVASASDCAGSIRIPAATCGLVGLKPGRRRVPWETGGWGGIAEEFVLVRSVRDARLLLDVLGDGSYFEARRSVRIGVSTEHWAAGSTDAAVVEAVETAARVLEDRGHHVDTIDPPLDNDELMSTWHALFTRWVAADVAELTAKTGRPADDTTLEPLTLRALEAADTLTAHDVSVAQVTQGRLTHRLDAVTAHLDVVLTPTIGAVEIPLGTVAGDIESMERYLELNDQLFPFSYAFNVAGWPSLSVPFAASDDGMPIGVQVSARPGMEHVLLDLADDMLGT